MDQTELINSIADRISAHFRQAVCLDDEMKDPEFPGEYVVRFWGANVTIFEDGEDPCDAVGHGATPLGAYEDLKYKLFNCASVMVLSLTEHNAFPEAFDPLPPEQSMD